MRISTRDGHSVVQTDESRRELGGQRGTCAELTPAIEAPAEWNANGHHCARVGFPKREVDGVGQAANDHRDAARYSIAGAELPAAVSAPTSHGAIGQQGASMGTPERASGSNSDGVGEADDGNRRGPARCSA